MSNRINPENWARFALAMAEVRAVFPEHGREIDKCIHDAGQKLESCGDPNCTCRMTFKNFRACSNRKYHTDGER